MARNKQQNAGRQRTRRAAQRLRVTARLGRGLAASGLRRLRASHGFERAQAFSVPSGRRVGGEVLAGAVSGLVTIAYCVSFSALIFQGELKSGISLGLWALLMGSAITGFYVALTTSLPPVDAGPDTPAVAVMSVLAGTVAAQIFSSGGDAELAVRHALLAITLATLLTGVTLYLLGRFRLGQLVRFVPFPVIGGFLAASGWLLATGGIAVITGRDFSLSNLMEVVALGDLLKIAIAVAFVSLVFFLRWRLESALTLPIAFFGAAISLDLILWLLGMMGEGSGWYLSGTSRLKPWLPLAAVVDPDINWAVFLKALAEIGSVAGVTAIALLLDVSSLEVARSKIADLDGEFRSNGIANIVAAPFGGLSGNLSMQSSRLLQETGGNGRASGVCAALFIGLVLVTGVDLPGLVPTPILAGLLGYVGIIILLEALVRSPAQNTWTDLGLALAIMVAIVSFGYLVGVMFGFIGACLMFAISYARVAVIHRHLTRAAFSSNVERAPAAARFLRAQGEQIHVFWLTGFIFFGSSNRLFENIRRVMDKEATDVRYIVMDFAGVSGFDTSALLSLVKLRNLCDERDVTLVYSGLSVTMLLALEQAELFGSGRRHQAFPSRNEALEWCEEQVLAAHAPADSDAGQDGFEVWLARELGGDVDPAKVTAYFERKVIEGGHILYRSGEPADTIDLVASGSIAITVADSLNRPLRMRRMSGQTVVGEMGFFRKTERAASVGAEGSTVVYTLTRASFDRMLRDDPQVGIAFLQFIIRALSDRVEFANQEIAALI